MSNRGYAAIGLINPKYPENVGGVLRAAGCYRAAMVAIAGERAQQFMRRLPTDTQCAHRHMPVLSGNDIFDMLPLDCVPVAVDLVPEAKSLVSFVHPERALYIFGPEDGTLDDELRGKCAMSVFVPTKHCMNLAATVNVVLYDRLAKQEQ